MKHSIYSHDLKPGEPVAIFAARGDVYPGLEQVGAPIAEAEAEGDEGGVHATFELEPTDNPSAATPVWVVSPSTVFSSSVPGNYPLQVPEAA
jgi:hypothetical protein